MFYVLIRNASYEYTQHTIFNINKSTASGAIYARSSVIFPHRMAFVRGEVDAVKREPKQNLIKKNWGKGGGGNPTTLTVSSLVSEF